MPRNPLLLVLTALVPLVLVACTHDDTSNAASEDVQDDAADASHDSSDVGGEDAGAEAVATDASATPDLGAGWTIFEPGGDTICSRGTPYRFAVRGGTTNRIVVDFMGGGACWDDLTCSVADSIFNEDVEGLADFAERDLSGIYDVDNPGNPFRDWYHVFIPYCTGDIHWGDARAEYAGGAFAIEHRGAVNAQAVFDWIRDEFVGPEQIFITGCSAGAYGSVGWTPYFIEAYPDARIAQLGDSGVGIITDSFFRDSFPKWNALPMMPDWVPTLDPDDVDIFSLTLSDLYGRLAGFYPEYVFSQYTTAFDDNQTFYFSAMGGGDQLDWSERMYSMLEDAVGQADNFASYVAPGERHCILPFDEFYSVESDGVRLVDWVNDLIVGDDPGNVRCRDCEPPSD